MSQSEQFPWGKLPGITIYNSLTRREDVFPSPGEHPEVSIYVCGPTTYSLVHVGNMRGPVFFDVVRRIFRSHGYRVRFVTNFTDIDDKMIEEAKRVGESDPIQLSAKFVHEYYTDLFSLGVEKADVYPKVSTHVPEIIDYVKLILENGHAYVGTDGSVYFDVASYPAYLELSRRNMDDLLDESRQDQAVEAKRDSRDFALWKAAKPGEPEWDFPMTPEQVEKFGEIASGRPGWHIECSVMSAKYLGATFDIHGGGQELRFPHHENEIAQAKCGHPDEEFARIWMHYEWVTLGGAKMAKSGESLKVRDVLKNHDPEVVRMFLLSAHYRKSMDFSFEKLDELLSAKNKLSRTFERLTEFLRWRAEERSENWIQMWHEWDLNTGYDVDAFENRMHDKAPVDYKSMSAAELLVERTREALYRAHVHLAADFNTQGAAGELFQMATQINHALDSMDIENADDFIAANIALGAVGHLSEILGILRMERESLYATEEARSESEKGGGDSTLLAEVLLGLREEARKEKNWALADSIRDRLSEIGAEIRDSKDGSRLSWNR